MFQFKLIYLKSITSSYNLILTIPDISSPQESVDRKSLYKPFIAEHSFIFLLPPPHLKQALYHRAVDNLELLSQTPPDPSISGSQSFNPICSKTFKKNPSYAFAVWGVYGI